MKSLRWSLLTALLLLLLAAPAAAFSDVAEDAWYHQVVTTCQERGLMNGVGDDLFAPDKALTAPETVVLAARLHELLRGGDGVLPEAPENYRTITTTKKDGSPASFHAEDYAWFRGVFGEYWLRYSDVTLTLGDEYVLTLVYDKTYTIPAKVVEGPDGEPGNWLYFVSPAGLPEELGMSSYFTWSQSRDRIPQWAMAAVSYLDGQKLWRISGMADYDGDASRRQLAEVLLDITPDSALLPVRNEVKEIPDLSAQVTAKYGQHNSPADFLAFYEAGILSGADEYGTWFGARSVKRSEVAAILARLLVPELRQSFTLETPDWYLEYTLAPAPADVRALLAEDKFQAVAGLYGQQVIVGTTNSNFRYYDDQGKAFTPAPDAAIRDFAQDLPPVWHMGSGTVTARAGYATTLAAPVVGGYAPYFTSLLEGWGLADEAGTPVIPPRFAHVGNLVDGKALVQKSDGTWWVLTVA